MDDVNLALLEFDLRSLFSKQVARMELMGLQHYPYDDSEGRRKRLHYVYRDAKRLLEGLDSNLNVELATRDPKAIDDLQQELMRLENPINISTLSADGTANRPQERILRASSHGEGKKRKRPDQREDGSASGEKRQKRQKVAAAAQLNSADVGPLSLARAEQDGRTVLELGISMLWGIDFGKVKADVRSAAQSVLSPHQIFNIPLILHDIRGGGPSDLSNTLKLGNDWKSRAASFCHEVKVFGTDRKGDFDVFYARMAKLQLYRCVTREGNLNFLSPAHAHQVASKAPYPSQTIANFAKQGQRLHLICGGHMGLIFLLPLLRDNGMTGVPHIPNITHAASRILSGLIRNAPAVRTICSLGFDVMGAARNGLNLVPEELRSLSLQLMDTDCLDVEKILSFLEPWAARPCKCL